MQENTLLDQAMAGDAQALETLLAQAQDIVFNLCLRELGDVQDAQDCTQETLIRVMTHLDSFRKESAFSTWVLRIALNQVKDYTRGKFARRPLSFEAFEADQAAYLSTPPAAPPPETQLLAEELKLSCTNVMLQCFDAQSRRVYVLGLLFHVDSRLGGELLGITPEAYRQRLSRCRKRMAALLSQCCGLAGGPCRCQERVNYAMNQGRLEAKRLPYSQLKRLETPLLEGVKQEMEALDDLAGAFASLPAYRAPESARAFLRQLIHSPQMRAVELGGQ